MKDSSSVVAMPKPLEKLDLLQLAFGDGTPPKSFFYSFSGGLDFYKHQPRRPDPCRRISLLAQNSSHLLRSILRHHLGSDYRETRKDENNGSMILS